MFVVSECTHFSDCKLIKKFAKNFERTAQLCTSSSCALCSPLIDEKEKKNESPILFYKLQFLTLRHTPGVERIQPIYQSTERKLSTLYSNGKLRCEAVTSTYRYIVFEDALTQAFEIRVEYLFHVKMPNVFSARRIRVARLTTMVLVKKNVYKFGTRV